MSSVSLLVIITFKQTLKQAKCKNIMKAKTALALKAMAGNKEKVNVSPITGANNANVNSRLKAA